MALENDPSRRIIARTRGELQHPGSCAVCGSDDPERTYVDFGIYFDYEGTMYICSVCFGEAAEKVMGYFTAEQHLQLLSENNSLIHKNEVLTAELQNYESLTDALRAMSVPIDAIIRGGRPSSEASVEDAKDGADGESETAEPVNDEGPSEPSGTEPVNRSKPVIS